MITSAIWDKVLLYCISPITPAVSIDYRHDDNGNYTRDVMTNKVTE